MTASGPGSQRGGNRRVVRFDILERAVHWSTAGLFAILMATGLALYFPSVGALVGRRELVAQIHLWTGIVLPVPLLAGVLGPWGRTLRRDVKRFNWWSAGEIRWLRTLGRQGGPVSDKFNPGQKLNAIFVGTAIVVMFATGFVLRWIGLFRLSWRTGATDVHDIFALAIFVVVAGHLIFALTHRDALRSMFRGWVSEAWARRHASSWAAEESALGQTTGGNTASTSAGPGSNSARRS